MAGAYRTGILPRALAEVQAIAAWWRKNRPAAPRLFQQELDLALANISERPEIGPKARLRSHPNARTYLLRRTGYVIIYNVDEVGREVTVARVRHGRRRPLARAKGP